MDFVERINKEIPSKEDLFLRYKEKVGISLTEDRILDYLDRMKLKKNEGFVEIKDVRSMIHGTNIWSVGIGSIGFEEDFEQLENGFHLFGYIDSSSKEFLISLDQKIYVKDNESIELVFDTEEVFMDFLLFYRKLNIHCSYKIKPVSGTLTKSIFEFKRLDRTGYLVKELIDELPIIGLSNS